MGTREEEYLKMLKALGYEPSLAGMDEEDFDYVPSWSSQNANRQPAPQLAKEYRPVDRDFAERIFNMFKRPFDSNWEMPNLDGPEYRQPPVGQGFGTGSDAAGSGLQPMSKNVNMGTNKWRDIGILADPLGQNVIYDGETQGESPQANTAPPTTKQPQDLWDEHIWKSPEVINAQTPKEKREAVNRIINERQGEFDAAYKTVYGDKAAGQWENDRKYTLNSMGDYVSADQLGTFGWQNVNDDMVKDLNDTLKKYDITTPARMRHFLAQCAQETDKGANYTEQDYGDKTYFRRMYEGQKDLGNIYEGDGEKFRGGGGIHITGRNEYQDFADYVNDPKVMEGGADYVAQKYPWVAAGRWWEKKRMNDLVDSLDGADHDADVDKVTDVVNYGDKTGRPPRKKYYKEWFPIIQD